MVNLERMIDNLIKAAADRSTAEAENRSWDEYSANLEDADRHLLEARELLLSTIQKLSK